MKINIETSDAAHGPPPLDLYRQKTLRRKTKSVGGRARLERDSSKRSAHHDTPLMKWMLSESIHKRNSVDGREKTSARKLGARIWRLQLPDFGINGRQMVGFQFESSLKVSNSSMEGATNFLKPAINSPSIPALEKQLKKARARINELETEGNASKDKVEQFLQKISEEKAAWQSRENGKVRAIVDDMKAELSREKKNRQRLEIVHSKLVNELDDAKLSFKRCQKQYGKERKARELAAKICDELARETGEDKAEVETLKIESKKLWEEMEDERKMLQMAEVWREERVQMKLVDARIMLEEKHSQINRIIADVEAFQKSRNSNPDMCLLFEGMNLGETDKREFSQCNGYSRPPIHDSRTHTATPEVKLVEKDSASRRRDVYLDHGGLIEGATNSEALSQSDGQGSSYSTNGNDTYVNNQASNVSREWERTPITECEISSKRPPHSKKASSISRLRRSCPSHGTNHRTISIEGANKKLSNGKLSSSETIMFPNCGSGKGCVSPLNLAAPWCLPHSGNQHRTRGTKGGIERTRVTQKSGLKSQFSEARTGSQKSPAA